VRLFTLEIRKYLLLAIPLLLLLAGGTARAATTVKVVYTASTCQYFVAVDRFGTYATMESYGPVYPSVGDTLTGNTELYGFQDLITQTGRTGRFWINEYWLSFTSLQNSYKGLCNITLTQGTSTTTTTPPTTTSSTSTYSYARADCIMNWAAAALPSYFKWTGPSAIYNGQAQYYSRPYASGYNLLFFDVVSGYIVVIGPMTGNTALSAGTMESLKPYTGC